MTKQCSTTPNVARQSRMGAQCHTVMSVVQPATERALSRVTTSALHARRVLMQAMKARCMLAATITETETTVGDLRDYFLAGLRSSWRSRSWDG